jgi:hypothetical protein
MMNDFKLIYHLRYHYFLPVGIDHHSEGLFCLEGQNYWRRVEGSQGGKVRELATYLFWKTCVMFLMGFRSKPPEKSGSSSNLFDRGIDRSIGKWSNLPKAPDQEVILLKKARGACLWYT